ncbi:phospho-sugar mutase [Haloechinothrix halophila]|uniref:phospho-sugar mutase n=1 Tax=Haloechinothrix halophila TaxID=1069073 RepID=UPI0003F6F24A|nr:phospho-sugar mutase [Haloechinothrix halophila]
MPGSRVPPELRDAAFRWIADDLDESDRDELQAVLAAALGGDAHAVDDLADRMAGQLRFGTAGLRGPVRAGPNGMNRAVVVRTTHGVAQWLRDSGCAGGIVVIGRDARHGSDVFAADAAGVLAAAGFDVRLFAEALPTPLLAFAVRELGAVAGIQLTASHNPAPDNGYKLYDGSGAQIVPPADTDIEATIGESPAALAVPRTETWRELSADVLRAYLDRVASLPRGSARDLRIALTPLYGVGGQVAVDALREAGFADVVVVEEQFAPDPNFGGMAFPNPEEPGACDPLLTLAEGTGADLAVALDPDADRCAIGIRDGERFRMLRGDETGALLGEYVLATLDRTTCPKPLVATTIVSSSMLGSIAAAHGAEYTETLTGFKWLARAEAADGARLVFAYEEALGLCVDPGAVRDKDGISAAILAADLAATRKAAGSSLADALSELDHAHGVHLTDQVSIRVTDLDVIGTIMARLRTAPPEELAGVPVTTEDLLPDADVLRFIGHGVRVVIRPSGTEPKLKTYLQVVRPADVNDADDAVDRLRVDVRELLARGMS